MLVVDVETTGVDSTKNSLLSIGAVDFNNPTKEFYEECRAFEGAHIDDESLAINGVSKDKVFDKNKKTDCEIVQDFIEWIKESKDHTVAGQNPQFDVDFILKTAERYHLNISLPHRVIDLHSVCYFHMIKRGIIPPVKNKRTDLNSDAIMNYVGIPPEAHPHTGISGAHIEAEAFSRLFYNKFFYEKYKDFKIPWL